MSETIRTYLQMGGYAPFIWPAYGIAAVILIAFVIDSWRRVHQATTVLRRLEAEAVAPARPARGSGAAGVAAGNKIAKAAVSAQTSQQRAGQQQAGQQQPGQQTPDQQVGS